MVKILIFSQRASQLEPLLNYSRLFSIDFLVAKSQEEVLSGFVRQQPQLLIAHTNGPHLQKLRFLHQLAPALPLLLFTERQLEDTTIAAFDAGADYILTQPCTAKELYYHLRNLLRLSQLRQQNFEHIMTIGNLKIFLRSNQVMLGDEFIPLTTMEYKLLMLFTNNINRTVSIDELYRQLYASEELKYTSRALQMHVSNLRRKLGLGGLSQLRLETVHKEGYCLRKEDDGKAGKEIAP